LHLFCFSTVEPGGGGTLLVEDSHRLAARLLREAEPGGLSTDDFDGPLTAILDRAGWLGWSRWSLSIPANPDTRSG
jgi:hypothetical protein